MNSQLITVDIPGLDLALGGGIWAVRRFPDANASATLLLRGPPGSGKTAFGTQLAAALGLALGGDVAYGCVELLPVELQAQYDNLQPEARAKVVVPPFKAKGPVEAAGCRIFTGLLDLGSPGQEQARLGPAIHALLSEVSGAKASPRVLVIDSLSEGYGLGSSAPRLLADALSKLAAERGLILVLLEEAIDTRPSTWSFTSDVVLELLASGGEDRSPGAPAHFERRVTVTKNRFGPSDAGPHRFEFLPSGLSVLPRPTAYLAPWAGKLLKLDKFKKDVAPQSWSAAEEVRPPDWPDIRECVIAVHGPEARVVRRVSRVLGSETPEGKPYPGTTLFIDFMLQVDRQRAKELYDESKWVINAANPYLSGHRLLAMVRERLDRLRHDGLVIEKVLVGDLRSLRSFWSPEGLRRAIAVITALLRQARIPVVLFETTAPRQLKYSELLIDHSTHTKRVDTNEPEPHAVDFADIVVELIDVRHRDASTPLAHITDVRADRQCEWDPFSPSKSTQNEDDEKEGPG